MQKKKKNPEIHATELHSQALAWEVLSPLNKLLQWWECSQDVILSSVEMRWPATLITRLRLWRVPNHYWNTDRWAARGHEPEKKRKLGNSEWLNWNDWQEMAKVLGQVLNLGSQLYVLNAIFDFFSGSICGRKLEVWTGLVNTKRSHPGRPGTLLKHILGARERERERNKKSLKKIK